MKKVYLAMSTDIIHHGHINIIKKARDLGEVTVGILTDDVIATYKRLPLIPFEQRKMIIENIKGVSATIKQESLDYTPNLMKLRPDYVIHGDDWKQGPQKSIRERVIEILKTWGGQLIEVAYTDDAIVEHFEKDRTVRYNSGTKTKNLRRLIELKPIVRVLEAHGLTGLIVEKTKIVEDGKVERFDGIWISSLCDSTSKGKPDIELVDLTSRMNTINEILEVTTKPIILDADTGGKIEHFTFAIKSLERIGVSAVIIEDKTGLKRNSLFGTEVEQTQDTIDNFCKKITAGKKAQVTEDFMIIARIESLITGAGVDDAIERAKAYIEAGADGIMIHSKDKNIDEIREFCNQYSNLNYKVPLVAVPTSYCHVTEDELMEMGIKIVIYANH